MFVSGIIKRLVDVHDKTVGYRVAKETSKDETAKVLYCTEAVMALIMQSHIQGTKSAHKPEHVTTVIIDEVQIAQCRATMPCPHFPSFWQGCRCQMGWS